jgi:serine/threonine protein kinase
VLKGKFSFDDDAWVSVSNDAKDLIKKLITRPERRLTAEEALQHKWFKKVFSKEELMDKKALHQEKLKSFKGF